MIYRISKKVFDILASVTAIVLSSPFWILAIIGIKVSSKGPIFYRAQRVGASGKVFTMYKFRSMHVYQPDVKDSNKASEGGYIANPQRMFKFGKFLRKSKLDELPQLINVLMSQMSIVGPRPISKLGAEKMYSGKYECILNAKPGLACLESLYDYAHGELFVSNNEEYIEKVLPVKLELAKTYVENQSILLDMQIIIRTIYLIFAISIIGKNKFTYTKYERLAYEEININRQEVYV